MVTKRSHILKQVCVTFFLMIYRGKWYSGFSNCVVVVSAANSVPMIQFQFGFTFSCSFYNREQTRQYFDRKWYCLVFVRLTVSHKIIPNNILHVQNKGFEVIHSVWLHVKVNFAAEQFFERPWILNWLKIIDTICHSPLQV